MAARRTIPTTTPAAMAATFGPDFFTTASSDVDAGAVVTIVVAAGALTKVGDAVAVGTELDVDVGAGASSGSTGNSASLYTFQKFFNPPPVHELACERKIKQWNVLTSQFFVLCSSGARNIALCIGNFGQRGWHKITTPALTSSRKQHYWLPTIYTHLLTNAIGVENIGVVEFRTTI